jgi:hypothetical protein
MSVASTTDKVRLPLISTGVVGSLRRWELEASSSASLSAAVSNSHALTTTMSRASTACGIAHVVWLLLRDRLCRACGRRRRLISITRIRARRTGNRKLKRRRLSLLLCQFGSFLGFWKGEGMASSVATAGCACASSARIYILATLTSKNVKSQKEKFAPDVL